MDRLTLRALALIIRLLVSIKTDLNPVNSTRALRVAKELEEVAEDQKQS